MDAFQDSRQARYLIAREMNLGGIIQNDPSIALSAQELVGDAAETVQALGSLAGKRDVRLPADLANTGSAVWVNVEKRVPGIASRERLGRCEVREGLRGIGYLREARRWWRTARRAADESEDHYTVLWIRGREIVRAGYEHRPLTTIAQLIDEAEARVGASPPVAAMPEFLGGKAQALALMGQVASAEAETTLAGLHRAFEELPFPVKAANDSIFMWGEERLRLTESIVYTYLGDGRKAEQAQNRALALFPADDLRSPAQVELQRALCLVGAGDVQCGIRHAQAIVSGLPAMHRIRPVADLGHKVLRAVPMAERQRPDAQEYSECLTASFAVPVPELTA